MPAKLASQIDGLEEEGRMQRVLLPNREARILSIEHDAFQHDYVRHPNASGRCFHEEFGLGRVDTWIQRGAGFWSGCEVLAPSNLRSFAS